MGWMALLDKDENEIGVIGDTPWDIMGDACREIIKVYQKEWHRKPTLAEITQAFEFVVGTALGADDDKGEDEAVEIKEIKITLSDKILIELLRGNRAVLRSYFSPLKEDINIYVQPQFKGKGL